MDFISKIKRGGGLLAVFAAVAVLAACVRPNDDNDEEYESQVSGTYPVENVDKSHTWNLSSTYTITVRVSGSQLPEGVNRVQVLTADPTVSAAAEVASEAYVSAGDEVTLSYSVPFYDVQPDIFVAAVTADDDYVIVGAPVGTSVVAFSGLVSKVSAPTNVKRQAFTYLFEDSFPDADDFDYNDIVMRIAFEPAANSNQLRMHVVLSGVGTKKQMAGMVNLTGVQYSEVASVMIEDGGAMDANYPLQRYMVSSSNTLIAGRGGQAVIRLFEDAHWAMLRKTNSLGGIQRAFINTTHTYQTEEDDDPSSFVQMDSISRTYLITFSTASARNRLSLATIDPFIMEFNSSICWETHTFQYKYLSTGQLTQVLTDINISNFPTDHYTWALCIPQSDFRYPVEGMTLGSYDNTNNIGAYFGAYNSSGHRFADWAMNRNNATDWYLYPTNVGLLY